MLKFNQAQWLKPYVEFDTNKRTGAETNSDTYGEALCKLIKQCAIW